MTGVPDTFYRKGASPHEHRFGPPRVVTAGTGDRVVVSECLECNTGAIALERAPDMTVHWLLEHLEGVERL